MAEVTKNELAEAKQKLDKRITDQGQHLWAAIADLERRVDTLEHPTPQPEPGPAPLAIDECKTGDLAEVKALWGSLDAVDDTRFAYLPQGGPSGLPGYALTVKAGDEKLWDNNARAELGQNSQTLPTFHLYREGDHDRTTIHLRIPPDYPLSRKAWGTGGQIKQTEPYKVALPEGVAFQFELRGGLIVFNVFWKPLFELPITAGDHVLEIEQLHSIDPAKGLSCFTVDGVQSQIFRGQTLAEDENGKPIPGHLRIGPYLAPFTAKEAAQATLIYGAVRVDKVA